MKVMLVMWSDGSYAGGGSPEDYAAWTEFESGLRANGAFVDAGQFHAPAERRVIATALSGGQDPADASTSPDGLVLTGYYLLECTSLDEATAYARRTPLYGSVEVRQLVEY